MLEHARNIVAKRSDKHGNIISTFHMVADLWSVYINHANEANITNDGTIELKPEHVINMLIMLKQVRMTLGDKCNSENMVDIAGYASLIAEIVGVTEYEND